MPSDPTPLDRLRAAKRGTFDGESWVHMVPIDVAESSLLEVMEGMEDDYRRVVADWKLALGQRDERNAEANRLRADVSRLQRENAALDNMAAAYGAKFDDLVTSAEALSDEVSRLTEALRAANERLAPIDRDTEALHAEYERGAVQWRAAAAALESPEPCTCRSRFDERDHRVDVLCPTHAALSPMP